MAPTLRRFWRLTQHEKRSTSSSVLYQLAEQGAVAVCFIRAGGRAEQREGFPFPVHRGQFIDQLAL
jgi:hypothetical protein